MAALRGISGNAAPMSDSETVGTSVGDPALGSLWTNATGDKQFVVVDCQQAFVAGEGVYIDHNHKAYRLNDTVQAARVGVITAAVSASDTKAYAQIYGLYEGAAGTSNISTSKAIGVPTGSSDVGMFGAIGTSDDNGILIHGIYAVTAADSATTSPPSSFVSAAGVSSVGIGFSVFLLYPYTLGTTYIGAVDT